MKILFFVGARSDDAERGLASDILEFATAERGAAPVLVGLVAEPEDCLQIALPMIGRGAARTIEGGHRERSAVQLYPFLPEEKPDEREDPMIALHELAETGAIELEVDAALAAKLPALNDSLGKALGSHDWRAVFVVGPHDEASGVLRGWQKERGDRGGRLVHSLDWKPDEKRARLLAEPYRDELNDDFAQQRYGALDAAMRFEEMIKRLGLLE